MKRTLPAFCYLRRRSGGRSYVYFERAGQSVRMTAEPGSPEFALEYAKLLNGVQRRGGGRRAGTYVSPHRADLHRNRSADQPGQRCNGETEMSELQLARVRRDLSTANHQLERVMALSVAIDADFERFVDAVKALGAMPEGYCFCSKERIGDDSKTHEPECRDIRALLDGRTE